MKKLHRLIIAFCSMGVVLTSCVEPTNYYSWQSRGSGADFSFPPAPQRNVFIPQEQRVDCSKCNGSGLEGAVNMYSDIPSTTICTQCNGKGYFKVY